MPAPSAGPSRREVLRFGSVAVASTALGPVVPFAPAATPTSTSSNDPAVIFVWLPGGPPHLDTFDMKPDAPDEYRGPFRPIRTNVAGLDVCEHVPLLAKAADKFAVIRSISHTFSDHGGGHKRFLTGRDPREPTGFVNDTPMVGAMAAEALRHRQAAVPFYVAGVDGGRAGIDTFSFGSAYLGPRAHPFTVVGDPAEPGFGVRDLLPAAGPPGRLAARLELLGQLDRPPVGPDPAGAAAGMDALRGRAVALMTRPEARTAFDLSKESAAVRERYGMHRYGQRALLARRLVEHGAGWVTMVLENATPPGVALPKDHCYNWDAHAVNCHIFEDTRYKLGFLDQALSALIEDIYSRGLDKRVLVVVTGEFGRTPKIETRNGRPGRDHWPHAMSVLVSGGGLRVGQVVGATTSRGEHPKTRPLSPNDLWATVFAHLGVDYEGTSFPDGTGRPMPILPSGKPIAELV